MSPHAPTQLEARCAPIGEVKDLAATLRPGGFLWDDGVVAFATRGIATRVPAHAVRETLRSIRVPDDAPDLALRAVGALPFDPTTTAELVIPAETILRRADGSWWRVTVADSTDDTDDTDELTIDPACFAVQGGSDRAHWDAMVHAALAAIANDDLTKVVLARAVDVTANALFDVPSILRRLQSQNPGCYVFADATRDGVFLGASPELLVARSDSAVTSRPMAGTVPAGASEAMLHTLKNEHEHQVVIDAVLDALTTAGVRIDTTTPSIATLSTVAHLATEIRGTATTDVSALDLARSLSPTPAVGGTPRETALAFISEHEGFDRGRYGGAVGWVDAQGNGTFAVTLRCGRIDGTTARLYAGAGIVAGSEPESEWAETQAKLEPMLRALVRP